MKIRSRTANRKKTKTDKINNNTKRQPDRADFEILRHFGFLSATHTQTDKQTQDDRIKVNKTRQKVDAAFGRYLIINSTD